MGRLLLVSIAALLCAGSAFAQVPPNDVCSTAIVFSCGQVVNLQTNTTAALDDYTQLGICTGFNSDGADIVYKIDIPPGGSVNFMLDTDPTTGAGSGYDGSLYLITNCASPSTSCLDGDDGDPVGGDFNEQISYTNNTLSTLTTYLIVDGFLGISFPDRGTGTLTGEVICPVPVESSTWGAVKALYR